MFQHKITFRNLRRGGIYSAINIAGLAISLAACILILLWVWDELSYEKFYKRSKDICMTIVNLENDGHDEYFPYNPTAVSYVAKENIPDVENACSVNLYYDLGYLEHDDKKFFDKFIAADTSFFRIFDNVFIEGSVANAFPDPYSVILTQKLAKRIFGDEPALGKELIGGNGEDGKRETYYVSGVVKDPPRNTLIQYKAVFSMERSKDKNAWQPWNFQNFLLLRPGADKKAVAQTLCALHKDRQPYDKIKSYYLQSLPDTHLYGLDGSEKGMASVRLFILIAFVLLIIACINYVNLVTARANKRNKEIAVRKIMGAKKGSLFLKLLSEAIVLFVISMVLSIVIVLLMMPFYSYVTGKDFSFVLFNPVLWSICGITLALVVVLAGIYPAVQLASFQPINALHRQFTGNRKGFSLRKALVILQFTGTISLIISTIVMNSQLQYILHKDLGYNKEQVLYSYIFSNPALRNHYESFKAEMEKEPGIIGVSGSELNILNVENLAVGLHWEGKTEDRNFNISTMGVDRNFFSLMNISLAEGSGFTGTEADSARFYFNETAIKQMGLENPVGKAVTMFGKTGVIAGVVKDFHFRKMDEPIGPIIMYLPSYYWTLYIKFAPGKIQEGLAATQKIWKKYNPDFPIAYQFMDEAFNEMYHSDQAKRSLFNYFSIVAILISCLGLFGLVTYTAETRTKEIGIRKVMGAKVKDIVLMLSKEFLILVGIAMLIAFPLAWYWLDKMLQDYVYRIHIGWWIFALAGLITIILTLLTVGWQAIKAATANPVKAIKTE